MEITWIIVVCFLGGLVQGTAGFGMGLITIALLGLIMPVREAAVLNVLAALSVNLFMIIRLRTHISMRCIWPTIPAVVLGAPLGVLLLVYANIFLLNGLLATILMIAGLQALLRNKIRVSHPWHPMYIGIPCGLLSGALSGAYGTGGPPLVAFVISQGFEHLRYVVTIQILLAFGGSIRLLEMFRYGLIQQQSMELLSSSAVAAVIGAALGVVLLRHLSEKKIRQVIPVLLLILAVRYLILFIT